MALFFIHYPHQENVYARIFIQSRRREVSATGKGRVCRRVEPSSDAATRRKRALDCLAAAPVRVVERLAIETPGTGDLPQALAESLLHRVGWETWRAIACDRRRGRARWRRALALRVIALARPEDAYLLLEAAVRDPDEEVRGAAVTLLGQLPHRWAAELLVAALVSSPHARSRVATALEASPVDVTDLLVEFLADPRPAVRYWSAVLLRRHPTATGLAPALEGLATDADPTVRKAALATLAVVGGDAALRAARRALLGEALREKSLYFDELFCNLVESGEQAGVLEALLDKIATYKEKTESIKKKIKKALTYPMAVIIVAVIVTTILLMFVVPVFEDLFKSFGADLPAFTQMFINMSQWLRSWWWLLFGSIGGALFTFFYFKKRSYAFNHYLDRLMLKIPVVGMILNKSAIARFARTLSTMSAAGVPLVEALESVAGACGNIVYAEAVLKMREEVTTGQRLQFAMQQSSLFPHMVQQMVAIGEESGSMDAMLAKVADFYEEEVDNLIDNLSSLMEPMIMAILGVLVGSLLIAMYLPIFKMGEAI